MNIYYEVPPLIGFGLSILLAVLVIRQHPYSFLHRIFALFLASMGLWALTIFGMRTSDTLGDALWWEHATFIVYPVISVSFYHFVLVLTGMKARGRILAVAYSMMAIFIGLVPTGLVVRDMQIMWYGYGFISGPAAVPYVIVLYGIVILAIVQLVKAYRASSSSIEKNRYAYIGVGAVLCVVGLFLDIIAARGVRVYPMGIVSNILFSLLTTYAMLKYHLLDFYMVVRRGATYVIVSALGVGVLIGVVSLVYLFGIDAWSLDTGMKVAFIIMLAVLLQPLLKWTQGKVDKWFYRGRYDYLRILENLGEETKTITDLGFIAASLVNTVAAAMQCQSVLVLLPDAEDKWLIPVAHRGVPERVSPRLRRDSVVSWWLSQRQDFLSREQLSVMPYFKALTAAEKEMLGQLQAELFVPLLTREGLKGVLVLGRKLSEQDYSPEETRMLRVVARQMATTLDNARLYDFQMRRYREQALLAKLSTAVSAELDLKKIYNLFVRELKDAMPIDFASINLTDEKGGPLATAFAIAMSPDIRSPRELAQKSLENLPGKAEPELHYNGNLEWERKSPAENTFHEVGMRSLLQLPLRSKGSLLGNFVLASKTADAYNAEDMKLLQQIAVQLAIAIDKSRLYEAERKARLELERQDRDRTDLVNALIHEIKTPLTAMVASAELLREELASDGSALGDLSRNLDVSTHNLDRRISELMDFAKVQSMETLLQVQPVAVQDVAERVAGQVSELLLSRQQTLKLDLTESPGYIKADPDRINQVLLNLLTNASKFSGSNQIIYLRSYVLNSDMIFEVHDSAPAIDAPEREIIFKPYYRRSKGKGSGGLGLGLFISKKLVQLHGGKIWIESDGSGNSFKFSLPLVYDREVKHESATH